MSGPHEQQSEVARLLTQISSEYEAAQRGLSGLAQGIAYHRFITKRMEQIANLHAQLRSLVGDEAMVLIDLTLNQLPEEKKTPDQKQQT